jgi:SPP1 family predicted phage head-tail adaptor
MGAAHEYSTHMDVLLPVKSKGKSGAPKSNHEYARTVPASLKPLRGRERFQAARLEATISHRIMLEYADDINARCQFRETDTQRMFHPFSVIDVDERHVEVEILATEVA